VCSSDLVIHVLDVTSNDLSKQVAIYACNSIDPFDFSKVVCEVAKKYNDAYVIIENNTYGHEVTRRLFYEFEYTNMFKENNSNSWGVNSNTTTKGLSTSLLKKYIESGNFLVVDGVTYKELCGFIEIGHEIFKSQKGKNNHDDRVMSLAWAAYFIGSEFWRSYKEYLLKDFTEDSRNDNQEDEDYYNPIIPKELENRENNILDDEDFYK